MATAIAALTASRMRALLQLISIQDTTRRNAVGALSAKAICSIFTAPLPARHRIVIPGAMPPITLVGMPPVRRD
ncbi:hypothetical protein AHIS1636_17380 [Arthrobacter mangrovi]|uniref:Uncharacterized protein n=1 Tax=Arthrobacter mangrovi TaxID=2966350 RepID=A0ABQ5MTM2_9MICC|nr:hypothetical protein AHIS1636_17380 [Arthrobacter mangrovi]